VPEPDFLSVRDFCSLSGLSAATVRRYLRDGKLPHVQVTERHRILIPRNALQSIPGTPAERPPPDAHRVPTNGGRPVRLSGRAPNWMADPT